MTARKRHHSKVRVFATCGRVDGDEKARAKFDAQRNNLLEHLFQERLFETLIDTVERHAAHFRVD